MIKTPIYMDFAATTPCLQEVVEAMMPYFTTFFGNEASSTHTYGWQAKAAVEAAANTVAQHLNCVDEEIIFTSGATESCNLAIRGVAAAYQTKGKHIITTKVEHKAVLDTCKTLEKQGYEVTYLDVDTNGLINIDLLKAAITPSTILLAIQFANNETGVLQNINAIGKIAKEYQVLFFTDATQAVGKINIDVNDYQVDLLCLSAHKIYGPKGVGVLYVRRRNPRVVLTPQITGGGQQKNRRSGTMNVPGIVGLAAAMDLVHEKLANVALLQNKLENDLQSISGSFINGVHADRIKGITNICFPKIINNQLLAAVKSELAISAGSACSSGSLEPSFVLTAMGLEKEIAKTAIRITIGASTTDKEVNYAVNIIKKAVNELSSYF